MEEQKDINTEQVSEELINKLEEVRVIIEENTQRVAELGKWPEHIKPSSLLERIPQSSEKAAPGFDAGIAAAAFHLEQMHRNNKHIHKFYLFAQEEVRKLK